jgi:hypothetical protein
MYFDLTKKINNQEYHHHQDRPEQAHFKKIIAAFSELTQPLNVISD